MTIDPTQPRVNSKVGPTKIGRGYLWMVTFELPSPAGHDGWIIQEVYKTVTKQKPASSYRSYHYWEAWPVRRNTARSTTKLTVPQALLAMGFSQQEVNSLSRFPFFNSRANDVFGDLSAASNSKGSIVQMGTARFYAVSLPGAFTAHNSKTQAGALRSTTTKPSFWQGQGSYRYLSYQWDFTNGQTKATLSAKNRSNWKLFQGARK